MRQEKNNSSNIFLRRPLSVSLPPQWATANLCVSRRPCSSTCLVCGLLGALWSQLRLWPVSNPSWTCPQSPLLLKARLVSVVEALTVYSDIPLVQDLSSWLQGFDLWHVQVDREISIPSPKSYHPWSSALVLPHIFLCATLRHLFSAQGRRRPKQQLIRAHLLRPNRGMVATTGVCAEVSVVMAIGSELPQTWTCLLWWKFLLVPMEAGAGKSGRWWPYLLNATQQWCLIL